MSTERRVWHYAINSGWLVATKLIKTKWYTQITLSSPKASAHTKYASLVSRPFLIIFKCCLLKNNGRIWLLHAWCLEWKWGRSDLQSWHRNYTLLSMSQYHIIAKLILWRISQYHIIKKLTLELHIAVNIDSNFNHKIMLTVDSLQDICMNTNDFVHHQNSWLTLQCRNVAKIILFTVDCRCCSYNVIFHISLPMHDQSL